MHAHGLRLDKLQKTATKRCSAYFALDSALDDIVQRYHEANKTLSRGFFRKGRERGVAHSWVPMKL